MTTATSTTPPNTALPDPPMPTARRRQPRRPMSPRTIQRNVALADPTTNRAVDRRWQVAVAIVQGTATQYRMRRVTDDTVKRAIRLLRLLERGSAKIPGALSEVHGAWQLRYRADLLTRSILEARLLADQPTAEIATACSLPIGVVRTYASLFFEVHDRLMHRSYIIGHAIGSRYHTGYTADDIDIILKSAAYLQGPMYLDYLLPYFTTSWSIPNRLDTLTVGELTALLKMIQIRAMIDAATMSGSKAIQAGVRLAAGKPGTLWAVLAAELLEMIDVGAGRKIDAKALVPKISSLSPESIHQLVGSYRPAPVTSKPKESLRMVG